MKKLFLLLPLLLLFILLFNYKNFANKPKTAEDQAYIIIEYDNYAQLIKSVNYYVAHNYKPQGGVSSIGNKYIQAMVKD